MDLLDITEYLFKILVVGEASVGKTSLIKRYTENEFSTKYKYTVGVDFALKLIEFEANTIVRLQLWDIAGQERFGVMTHVYYKQADAAVIVCDITNRQTFSAVQRWKADLDNKVQLENGDPVPAILLANKCDMTNQTISAEELDKFIIEHGFIAWFEVSAKVGCQSLKSFFYLRWSKWFLIRAARTYNRIRSSR
eukprot:TRINITY_DN5857_c0_g1_i2.p1 TRINITY_DN5857_c0_g1~~TRINITY_DN5857_c0_g1_i2.p1  ORF type:complete len:194 (+),score=11.46 TRINITY_DN5857_c0_g1_i2:111-692(+)